MLTRLKQLCHRFIYGPDPPKVSDYEDLDTPEHDLLKPNGVEYRLPVLLKPPKVKFKYKQPKMKRPS